MITQKQLEKEGISVGDYYVVRRGKRIAVMNPVSEEYTLLGGDKYPAEPPTTETVFTETQARHLLGAYDRLQKQEKEREGIEDKIEKLNRQISDLEEEIYELEEKQNEEITEDFKSYEITLDQDGDGIRFGCTEVSKADLRAIKKLLDKK